MVKKDRTALVTGASSGLGAALSWLFAADGYDLVLVARRRRNLEALAEDIGKKHGVRVTVLAFDLGDADAPARIATALEQEGIEIEMLVNNAGFGTTGAFAQADLTRELAMLHVNVAALVHLTGLFLPAMVARGSGRVLNLGSTAGFQPGPFMAGYYASKAFVSSFTEALSFELRGTGVTATVSCPGATATEFARTAGVTESRLFQKGTMSADEVARHAYRAMMRGESVAIPGLQNKLGVQSLRVAPRAMVLRLAAALNQTTAPLSLQPAPARS